MYTERNLSPNDRYYHIITTSPLHPLTTSPPHHFTTSPLHHLTTSPLQQLTTSPPHPFTSSPQSGTRVWMVQVMTNLPMVVEEGFAVQTLFGLVRGVEGVYCGISHF